MLIIIFLIETIANIIPDPYQSYDEYQGFLTNYLYVPDDYKCIKQIIIFVLEDIRETSLLFSFYKFDVKIYYKLHGDPCIHTYESLVTTGLNGYFYRKFKVYPPLEKEIPISITQTKINVHETELNLNLWPKFYGVKTPILTKSGCFLETAFHTDYRHKFINRKILRKSDFLYFLEINERLVFPLLNRKIFNESLRGILHFEQKQEILFVEDDFSYFYFVFHPNRKFLQISLFTGLLRLDNNTNTFSAVDNFDEVSVDSLTVVKRIEKMELGSELTLQKSVLGYLRLAANKLVVENKYLRGFCKLNKFVVEDCSTATFGKLVNEFVAHSLFAGKVKSSLEKTLEAEKTVPSKACEEEKKIISEKEKERVDFYKAIEQKKEELNKLSIELTESKTTLTEIGREYETHDRNKREIEEKIKELKKEKTEIEVKKEEKLKMKEKLEKEKENELFQLQTKIRLANEELTTTTSEIKDLQKKIGNQELYFKVLLGLIGITGLIVINLYQKNP